jgi:3-polyprenyl-4-hydroxybenzoate decarboxylase
MAYKDRREFIDQAEKIGELLRLDGVDWNEEVGAIYAIYLRQC